MSSGNLTPVNGSALDPEESRIYPAILFSTPPGGQIMDSPSTNHPKLLDSSQNAIGDTLS
jgi:hypothetical protein